MLRLTNFKIKSAGIGQRLHDGRGLYLTLSAPKKGKWTIRYMLSRKAKEMGLGRYPGYFCIYSGKISAISLK